MSNAIAVILLLTLGASSRAQCDDNGDTAPPTTTPAYSCNEVYDPVCSTSGVTYSNSCYLSLANQELAYRGVCGSPPIEASGNSDSNSDEAPTTTTPNYECLTYEDPVCSTDGITYSNGCFLARAGKIQAYRGACGSPVEMSEY